MHGLSEQEAPSPQQNLPKLVDVLVNHCVHAARKMNLIVTQLWVDGSLAMFSYTDAIFLFTSTMIMAVSVALKFKHVEHEDQGRLQTAWRLLHMMNRYGNKAAAEFLEQLELLTHDLDPELLSNLAVKDGSDGNGDPGDNREASANSAGQDHQIRAIPLSAPHPSNLPSSSNVTRASDAVAPTCSGTNLETSLSVAQWPLSRLRSTNTDIGYPVGAADSWNHPTEPEPAGHHDSLAMSFYLPEGSSSAYFPQNLFAIAEPQQQMLSSIFADGPTLNRAPAEDGSVENVNDPSTNCQPFDASGLFSRQNQNLAMGDVLDLWNGSNDTYIDTIPWLWEE